MHRNTWEIAFPKQFVQFCSSQSALDKDDDLVELEGIQQLVEFPILLCLAELDVVLLKAVESELRLVIDIDL